MMGAKIIITTSNSRAWQTPAWALKTRETQPLSVGRIKENSGAGDVFISSLNQSALSFGARRRGFSGSQLLKGGWPVLAMASWERLRHLDRDLGDFMDIVDGNTTEDYLMDRLVNEEFEVDKDGGITINKPQVKIPTIRHGHDKPGGGGSSGDGDDDDDTQTGQTGKKGDNKPGKGGKIDDEYKLAPWKHRYGPSEIAQVIGRQFGLPFLRPSEGESNRVRITKDNMKFVPPGDVWRKKTFANAVRTAVGRAVAQGEQPDFNNIYPERAHRRYKAMQAVPLPDLKVAVIYLADVSASVDKNLRNFTKNSNRFVSYPLKYKYGKLAAELDGEDYNDADYFGKDPNGTGLQERFVTYTNKAKEVTEEDFYNNADTGGTTCSAAFDKAREIIEKDYPPSQGWNVYIYHFTDGDNMNEEEDNPKALGLIKGLIDAGVRYIGHCDLGCAESSPSIFRKALLKDKTLKDNPHIGSVGISKRPKYTFNDYKKVVQTFLPVNKEEPEWYEMVA